MPEGEIALQAVHHPPALDIGQADIKCNRVGFKFACHRQRRGSERRDESLEALLARRLQQEPGEGEIIFDDQEHQITGMDDFPIVADFVDAAWWPRSQAAPRPAWEWFWRAPFSTMVEPARRTDFCGM